MMHTVTVGVRCEKDLLRMVTYRAVLRAIARADDKPWKETHHGDAARQILRHFGDLPSDETDPIDW